ncbi:MAG: PAS domain S-box protein [Sphingobacteriaceae bacterium]|nr:MAG: PAS domain S-box protein [Sphingobacteriaceae bacterium]
MTLRFSEGSSEKKDTIKLVGDDKTFKKLTENSFSGIGLLDEKLNVIYLTASAERISGWDIKNRLKITIDELIHPSDLAMVSAVLREVLASPEIPKTCSFRSKYYKGHYIWLQFTFTNRLNEADIKAIVCNFIDISNQKQSEEKLEQTVSELSAYKYALDEASIVAITDHKGIIKHVNDNFCSISKYTKDELIGQDHRIINSSYHSKAFIKNLWVTIANGKIWRGELKNKAKDGSYYWVDTTIVPFLDENTGKPYQYVAIRSDITERKLAQEKNIDLLENITDGFISLDENMCYTYANKRIGKLIGIDPESLIGKNIWEVFPDAVSSLTWQAIQTAFTEKKYVCNEDYYEPLGLWQENRVYPSGNGISMFIRDITQKKKEEQHLRLLESVITNTTDAVLITDADPLDEPGPRIIYVNDAFTKMTGYTAQEVIGKTPRILQGPKSDKEELKRLSNAMRNFEPCEVTIINYKKNGEEFWVNFSVSPVADGNGKYAHLIAIERDVTSHKEIELQKNQLAEAVTNAYIERNTILESIADAFFAVDKDWVVTYWNKTAAKVLGKSKEAMLGNKLWDVFADAVGSTSYQQYNQAVKTHTPVHFEDYYEPLNQWYEISAYPTGNGLSVYFKDITDRKLYEIKLTELNQNLRIQTKELAISNAELEQFAYVASHDLQEPLRMVTSFLTQIEKKYAAIIDDKGKQYIHFAVDGAKRMRQIILDLLEFSRVGRAEESVESIDLNVVVNDIIALYKKKIEDKKAVIMVEKLPIIHASVVQVRQVFQNLISNALKYHKAGNAPLLNISFMDNGKYWQFAVKDNGIGIDPEYFDKIFIIFQRLHNKDEYSGTGMGLAVTKKIIENLGGKVWVESEEGEGTTFYFTILKN